ncbi:MAG: 1-acyl-sn-glycerol-3-phosphate acyltransferase [Anaerolineales bacterium]
MDKLTDVESLTQYITDEIFRLFKLSRDSWERRIFGPLFRLPTHRFARLAATFDQYVAEYGFREAAMRILPVFAQAFEAHNVENIPREGPLLITSNHPGTCDSIVITASIPRPDLKIVATGVPFVQELKNAASHLIYTTIDVHERMMVVRSIIRHLKEGGAVLIFPSGRIDPDPALSLDAADDLGRWSPSVEIVLRHVPQTRVLLTVVSDVLSARWRWNPFVRLMGDDHKQRSVAEFLQVIQQMIFPNSITVNPRVTYSNPLTIDDLKLRSERLIDGMIERSRCLMEEHMAQRELLLPAET